MEDRLESDKCSVFLKALADPQRLKLVQCLQTRAQSVTELADELQDELRNVSHHLGVLKNAGLVESQRSGRQMIYTLVPGVLRPAQSPEVHDSLDLGCCRLVLGPTEPQEIKPLRGRGD
ncbi:MAG: winged helix-turn-helix transcriptional regulator [Pirellulales bacterium]|nr:winged helix-turn-helix transcriptional regulator [Pirellulales bacterium]